MRKFLALILIICLSLSLCSCSAKHEYDEGFTDGSEIVFDFGSSSVTIKEALYFIAYYEMFGQYVMSYYQNSIDYSGSYWDEIVDVSTRQTERDYYKQLAMDSCVYYEVFKNAALKEGVTLTDEMLSSVKDNAKESFEVLSMQAVEKSGATYEGFLSELTTVELASTYIDMLRDEAAKTKDYKKVDEKARKEEGATEESVAKATEAFLDEYISKKYEKLSKKYNIKVNDELWDSLIMGTVTISE